MISLAAAKSAPKAQGCLAPPQRAFGTVSLASLRSNHPEPWKKEVAAPSANPRKNPNFQPRKAHPGGTIRSNKNEALLLFLKRQQQRGVSLTSDQAAALALASGDASASENARTVSESRCETLMAKLEQKVAAGEEDNPLLRQQKGKDLRLLLPDKIAPNKLSYAAKVKQKSSSSASKTLDRRSAGGRGQGRGHGRGRYRPKSRQFGKPASLSSSHDIKKRKSRSPSGVGRAGVGNATQSHSQGGRKRARMHNNTSDRLASALASGR